MTWTLIVAYAFAFPGFESKEACLLAAQAITPHYTNAAVVCVPTPLPNRVVGAGYHQ